MLFSTIEPERENGYKSKLVTEQRSNIRKLYQTKLNTSIITKQDTKVNITRDKDSIMAKESVSIAANSQNGKLVIGQRK